MRACWCRNLLQRQFTDFRSPNGLYSQMAALNELDPKLEHPEQLFEMAYFTGNPYPFYQVIAPFYKQEYKPTLTLQFLNALHQHGVLLACITQNIDGLELQAGLPQNKVLQIHGSLEQGKCTKCGTKYDRQFIAAAVPTVPTCTMCQGTIKPGIVMYGERMNGIVMDQMEDYLEECDFLIVIGTSLTTAPACNIPAMVNDKVPRLFINKSKLSYDAKRDVMLLGDCDEITSKIIQYCAP